MFISIWVIMLVVWIVASEIEEMRVAKEQEKAFRDEIEEYVANREGLND